jgi:hypothetical protein
MKTNKDYLANEMFDKNFDELTIDEKFEVNDVIDSEVTDEKLYINRYYRRMYGGCI